MRADPVFILHAWLRRGDTSAGRGVSEFFPEALSLLPIGWRVRSVREDSGFFNGWREPAGDYYAVAEFTARLLGWSRARRFVVVRERVRETKAAVGRKLLDVPGYTYRLFVTDRTDAPEELWRDYNRRATMEQHIDELKHDLVADDFCRHDFCATEAAFRAVTVLFNLRLWQTATRPAVPRGLEFDPARRRTRH